MSQRRTSSKIGAVVIGRNEGARLTSCLNAVMPQADNVVYVDSGSTDGSQQAAHNAGADLIALDMATPFTAARARNAGVDHLLEKNPTLTYVQFIDGDCELQPDWISTASSFLALHDDVAVVCGRRRERFPDASIYNTLIDQEWDTPIGQASSCGGDALMRVAAFKAVNGYNGALIAGEEPELCVRLRAAGWRIWRLDAEMTLHDAALTRFEQWWQRNKRAGHAYAEGVSMHGAAPERHGVRETISAMFWGVALPATAIFGMLWSPWTLMLLLVWPLQVMRLGMRDNDWLGALFLTLGKLPEAQGMLGYWWHRLWGVRTGLIEYK